MKNLKISKLIKERNMQKAHEMGRIEMILRKGFTKGETFQSNLEEANRTYHTIGELVVTSGSIVACDPLAFSDVEPFAVSVPNGSFPLTLCIANLEDEKHIVEKAILNFSYEDVAEWKPALIRKIDPYYSGEEMFDYTVDSGTGCFMDKDVAELLLSKKAKDIISEFIVSELGKNSIHNCNYANIKLKHETKGTLIAFSSGFGDGIYCSYFGYDRNGKVACLVTDFAFNLLMGNLI